MAHSKATNGLLRIGVPARIVGLAVALALALAAPCFAQAPTDGGSTAASANPTAANVAPPATPAPSPIGLAENTWTTYLYQGPGPHYSVIDELQQATPFNVLGCGNGWCEVQFENRRGYLRQEIIAQGDPAKPATGVLAQPVADVTATQPKGPCFEANQKGGNGGNALTVFCEK